jgi:hypothetical protein
MPKECPTFEDWFKGRVGKEWVVGRKNKPSVMYEKDTIYRCHLGPRFGEMALDEITVSEIARLRADLVAKRLGEKRTTTSSPCCRRRCATRSIVK